MWSKVSKESETKMLDEAILFIGNHSLYGDAMREVMFSWVNTMENHLTNLSINRRAFLGHCAVFYKKQIPEYIVRAAWKHLDSKQRILADLEADKHIKEWEIQYMSGSKNTSTYGKENATKTGFQMKLQLS